MCSLCSGVVVVRWGKVESSRDSGALGVLKLGTDWQGKLEVEAGLLKLVGSISPALSNRVFVRSGARGT